MKKFALAVMLATSGCAGLAPPYHVPALAIPPSFKEAPGWVPANPADESVRGDWWTMFNDAELNHLEPLVAARNQTVAGAVAAYEQATAIVRQQQASLFPTITANGSISGSGTIGSSTTTTPITTVPGSTSGGTTSGGTTTGGTTTGGTTISSISTGSSGSTRFGLGVGASWQPDLFGQIRTGVRQARATADAQRATLGNVILAAQAELASDYVQLRGLDAQSDSYATTIAAYQRALRITQNRYKVGVAARIDVLQAQSTLSSAQAAATDLVRQRKQFEHAIAVLAGDVPANLSIARGAWDPVVPEPAPLLPSILLERRPDIAAAERQVMAANYGIGVQRGAYFPSFNLTAGLDQNASSIGKLFSLGSSIWSFGLSGALTLLDFGGRAAKVAQARAAFDQAAANYRQTVLTAFQQVEDGLSGTVLYRQQQTQLRDSSIAASRVEQLTLNQYLAGIADYTTVATAQATALNARRAAIAGRVNQQLNAIALSQAVGGGWDTGASPAVK